VNLQKTGAFSLIEIKETSQDKVQKELQAFKYELLCGKLPNVVFTRLQESIDLGKAEKQRQSERLQKRE
jgi:hypothetical protein